jgi:hypothetical protein
MSFNLPVGIDRAEGYPLPSQPTGSGGNYTVVGTAIPTGAIQTWNGGMDIQEPTGSPVIERAEQCTCSHKLNMSYDEGLYYFGQIGRGVVVTDTGGNIWRVLSSSITNLSGNRCEFSYVMESISFDSPPDDFNIEPVSLDLNIVKHPRYFWALSPYQTDESTYTQVGDTKIYYTEIKEAIVRMIQNYTDSPFYPSQAQVQGLIQSNILSMLSNGKVQINYPNPNYDGSQKTVSPVPWDGTNANLPTQNCVYFAISVNFDINNASNPIVIALAAAQEIISKLWRQEDAPYIVGYKVTHVQRFFQPVYLNPGGYREDPRDFVPSYFISPGLSWNNVPRGVVDDFGNAGDTISAPGAEATTIFDDMVLINPQSYSDDGTVDGKLVFSSLRLADRYRYERTWFEVTHEWLVAPVGKWDSDLYKLLSDDGPQDANDFNQNPIDRASA